MRRWENLECRGLYSQPVRRFYYLNFARVGGSHMQGISGRSHSPLLQALNNAADGGLQLARRVKIDEKKDLRPFLPFGYNFCNAQFYLSPLVFSIKKGSRQFSCKI